MSPSLLDPNYFRTFADDDDNGDAVDVIVEDCDNFSPVRRRLNGPNVRRRLNRPRLSVSTDRKPDKDGEVTVNNVTVDVTVLEGDNFSPVRKRLNGPRLSVSTDRKPDKEENDLEPGSSSLLNPNYFQTFTNADSVIGEDSDDFSPVRKRLNGPRFSVSADQKPDKEKGYFEPTSSSLLDTNYFQTFADADDAIGLDRACDDFSPVRRRLKGLNGVSADRKPDRTSVEFWKSQLTRNADESICKPEISIGNPEISITKNFWTTDSRNRIKRKLITDPFQSFEEEFYID